MLRRVDMRPNCGDCTACWYVGSKKKFTELVWEADIASSTESRNRFSYRQYAMIESARADAKKIVGHHRRAVDTASALLVRVRCGKLLQFLLGLRVERI